MKPILHLVTQRNQPFGSVRKCCEVCGKMGGPYAENSNGHYWTDESDFYYSTEFAKGYQRCSTINNSE